MFDQKTLHSAHVALITPTYVIPTTKNTELYSFFKKKNIIYSY